MSNAKAWPSRLVGVAIVACLVLCGVPSSVSGADDAVPLKAKTYHDVIRQADDYYKTFLIDAYQKVGKHDAKWDAAAVAVLQRFARESAWSPYDPFYHPDDLNKAAGPRPGLTLNQQARTIIQGGCTDAVVTAVAESVQPNSNIKIEIDFAKIMTALEKSDFSPAIVARAVVGFPTAARGNTPLGRQWSELMVSSIKRSATMPAAHPYQRREWAQLVETIRAEPKTLAVLADELAKAKGADPWLTHYVQAVQQMDIVRMRPGGDWQANYELAAKEATAAWNSQPDLPDPAALMIAIRAAYGDWAAVRAWFEKARQAQFDFQPTLLGMMTVYGPGWQEDLQDLKALGEQFADSGRFDTLVPAQYFETLRRSAAGRRVALRDVLAEPGVYEKVAAVCKSYVEQGPAHRKRYHLSLQAAAAYQHDDFLTARAALDALKQVPNGKDRSAFAVFDVTDAPTAASQIFFQTGPWPERFRQAEQLAERGKYEEAVAQLQKQIDASPASDDGQALQEHLSRFRAVNRDWFDVSLSVDVWKRRGKVPGISTSRGRNKTGFSMWQANPDTPAFLILDEAAAKFSRPENFEVEMKVVFEKPDEGGSAGLVFYVPATESLEYAVVDLSKQSAAVTSGGVVGKPSPVKVGASCQIRVQYSRNVVQMFVDGVAVGQPAVLPKTIRPPFDIGVGSPRGLEVHYDQVRIKGLPDTIAAKLAASASALAAKPGDAAEPGAAAPQPEKPAVTAQSNKGKGEAPSATYHDVIRDASALFVKRMVDQYQSIGQRDPRWDAAAIAFLEAGARRFVAGWFNEFYKPKDVKSFDEVVALGAKAYELGCRDSLVHCLLACQYEEERPLDATNARKKYDHPWQPISDETGRALLDLLASKYDDLVVASLAGKLENSSPLIQHDHGTMYTGINERWLKACSNVTGRSARRHLCVEVWEHFEKRRSTGTALAALRANPNVDPFLLQSFVGRYHIGLAWERRGSGSANTVDAEGWKGFNSNLEIARDALVAAWKIDPAIPQTSSEMIRVAMGGGEALHEDVGVWFDRARAAQRDYAPAFETTFFALRPRWGGSYEQMLAAGAVGLDKPDYNTLVPFEFIKAIVAIGADQGDPFGLFANESVYRQTQTILNAYGKTLADDRAAYFYSAAAAVALKVAAVDDARAALDALKAKGQQPSEKGFLLAGITDPKAAVSEIYLRTTLQASIVEAAVRDASQGHTQAALKTLRGYRDRLKPDDSQRSSLDQIIDRIAWSAEEWVNLRLSLPPPVWTPSPASRAQPVAPADSSGEALALAGTKLPQRQTDKMVLWDGTSLEMKPAKSFEAKARCCFFDHQPAGGEARLTLPNKGEAYAAGFVLFSAETKRTVYAVADFGQQKAGFVVNGRFVAGGDEKIDAQTTLHLVVQNGQATLFVNDRPVGKPYPLDAAMRERIQFGLGGPDANSCEFRDVAYRKLKD